MTQPEHVESSLVALTVAARCQAALEQVRALAASAAAPSAFHAQLLRLVMETTGAEAGVTWVRVGESRLNAAAEVRLAETGWRTNMALRGWCEPLIREVLAAGGVRQQSADISDANGVSRTRHLLLFSLQRGTQVAAVVQLFENPSGSESDRLPHLRFVESIMVIVGGHFDRTQPSQTPAAGQNDLRALMLSLHHSLRFRDVAAMAANDLRLWYGVDRVSIAERVGNRVVMRAISGQQKLNQKANVLKFLTHLATAVVKSNECLVFEGDPGVVPLSLERRLADYLHEGKSRRLAIIPLVEPDAQVLGQPAAETPTARRRPLGALVIEQFSDRGLAGRSAQTRGRNSPARVVGTGQRHAPRARFLDAALGLAGPLARQFARQVTGDMGGHGDGPGGDHRGAGRCTGRLPRGGNGPVDAGGTGRRLRALGRLSGPH